MDSRRNTIESTTVVERDRRKITADSENRGALMLPTKEADSQIEEDAGQITNVEYRKLRKCESLNICSSLSVESTDTTDGCGSEKTVSSSDDSVSVTKKDGVLAAAEMGAPLSAESELNELEKSHGTKSSSSQASLLRPGESIESSDAGTISSRTGSVSDFSRQNTESRSVITQSSASLASWSDCSRDIRFADRRTARCDGRSSSEETNSRAILTRQRASTREPLGMKTESVDTSTISRTTSQDSLSSERGDGSITYHRYYHVFRENELNSLIHDFLGNLHVISSFYDHTNWCIIAEKVRVWTI